MNDNLKKMANSRKLLLIGLALALGGLIPFLLTDAEGLLARALGFCSGLGLALCGIWAFVQLRRRSMSPEKYEDAEREMTDERGQLVSAKATAAQDICGAFCIVVMTIAATVRGDHLFMLLGVTSCFAIAVSGFVARWWYNRKL